MTPRRPESIDARRSRRGFTLVEAIASITILALIGGLTSQIIFTASRSWMDAAAIAELERETSLALDRIITSLRSIERDPAAPEVALRIDAIGPNMIAWHGDHSLSLENDVLILREADATLPLARNIASLTVTPFGPDGQMMPGELTDDTAGTARRITIGVVASRGDLELSLRTSVFLRSAATAGDAS